MPTPHYTLYRTTTEVTNGDALACVIRLLMELDVEALEWALLSSWRSVLKWEDKKATEALMRLADIEVEARKQGMTTEQVRHVLAARDAIAAEGEPDVIVGVFPKVRLMNEEDDRDEPDTELWVVEPPTAEEIKAARADFAPDYTEQK